ncbi:MAG: hypothetical protein H8D97_01720 [Proteobacteria bacterium]|nr:hypothetical protein [Pseudomonadota bacterium]
MSADNSVIVAKFSDETFRVGHGSAAENLECTPDYYGYSRKFLNFWFKDSEVYSTKMAALIAAHDLHDRLGFVEYGVSVITVPAPFPG